MRTQFVYVIAAGILAAATRSVCAQSAVSADVPKPVEQCIRDNAGKVEQAITSLTEATEFLVVDICAKPIAEERRRGQVAAFAAAKAQYKKCESEKSAKSSRPTENDDYDECALARSQDAGVETIVVTATETRPPGAMAFAAQTLLSLRLAKMNATHTQGTH